MTVNPALVLLRHAIPKLCRPGLVACLLLWGMQAHAARDVTSATLNGGATVTVAPGATIAVVVSVTTTGTGTANDWESTGWRISTTAPGAVTCVNHVDYSTAGSFQESFNITAPATPGTYNAYFVAYDNSTCSSGADTLTMTGAIVVNAPPTVSSINRASTNPASAGSSVSWTVTFSESVTGVDAGDFALAATLLSGTSITSVSGSGTTWTVTANTGSGAGSLGLNLVDNNSIVDSNSLALAGAADGSFTGQVYAVGTLAEYRLLEASWNGTAGEVADNVGSYTATAAGLAASRPTTANATPAIAGDPGTCRYGVFTRANKHYLAVNSSFPNLGASGDAFTITAWIRTTDRTQTGQRIFIDDENNTTGYGFSVADETAGTVRFYTRGVNPVSTDSGAVVSNNTWYFVAAVADVPNKTKTVYVYNAAGTLLSSNADTWTEASFGSDAGPPSIGGETNAAGEGTTSFGFGGWIDEVKIFRAALDAAALNVVRQQTHNCIQFHHLEISDSSGGDGLTCSPSTLTVRACANADCSLLYTGGVSGTLTASGTATVNWGGGNGNFNISAGNSSVTKTIQVTTPGSAVTIGVAATPIPAPTNATTCTFAGCSYTAADAGLLLNVPNHYSCTPQSFTIQAVRRSATGTACIPAFQNVTRDLTMYLSYMSPATGTQTASLSFASGAGGGTTSNVAALSTNSGAPTTLTNLYWNNSGTASITNFRYQDAGQIQLNPSVIGSGATNGLTLTAISGNQPIVAPSSLVISGIPSSLTAGSPFNTTITARNSCTTPATTPNFTATVPLTSSNPVPALGNATHFTTNVTSYTNGVGSADLTWNEVGSIDITATLATYLGWTLPTAVTATTTATPFRPGYFDVFVVNQGCGTFTYGGSNLLAGQPFTVRIKAKRTGGDLNNNTNTANFTGAWAETVALSDANSGTGTLVNNSFLPTEFNTSGIGTRTDVNYRFAAKPASPYTLVLRATAGTVNSSTHTEESANMRSGRLRLLNAFGSATQPLSMYAQTQYWSGSAWVPNGDDSCTTLAAGNFNVGTGASAGALSISSGNGTIVLTPSSSNTATVDVAANLGAAGSDNSCLASHGGTAADRPWLRSLNGNCAATYDRDPSARATFGVYSPENQRTIHVRELY